MRRYGGFRKSHALSRSVLKGMTAKYLDRVAAKQRAELYYDLHPGSPAAVRAPRLFTRSGVWVALLGRNVRDGISGFGATVEAALRAFDEQYLNALHPPVEKPGMPSRQIAQASTDAYNRSAPDCGTALPSRP
jgi:hypothetical protein